MIRPIREITAQEENFRLEPAGENVKVIKRDPVEPVPVGSLVVMLFQVTGYDPDCDGSLMARLARVDNEGEFSGLELNCIGLTPDSTLVVDTPEELWQIHLDKSTQG